MKTLMIAGTIACAALGLTGCATMDGDGDAGMSSQSGSTVKVGGADMFANRNIVENAVNSPIHTTLVAAVQAAGLAETLSGPGPFTVFAPVNDSFAALPAGTVDTLLRPENKAQLQSVLTYHVLAGNYSAAQIMAAIRAGNGTATFPTVQGGSVRASMRGSNVVLTGANGSSAVVTQADVRQSNGVIHVVRGVLLPG